MTKVQADDRPCPVGCVGAAGKVSARSSGAGRWPWSRGVVFGKPGVFKAKLIGEDRLAATVSYTSAALLPPRRFQMIRQSQRNHGADHNQGPSLSAMG